MTDPFSKSRRIIPILYEDDVSVVFDKPPGLVVFSDQNGITSLDDIVNKQYFKQEHLVASIGPTGQAPYHLHPCHRLDRDTTGAILFARGKKNQQLLMNEFKMKRVKKKYIAFVHGRLRIPQGEIKGAVKDFYQKKFAKDFEGSWALTRFKVIKQHKNFSVLEVIPVTGRTNQIRIHLSENGHPLVGEDKYAFRRDFELRFKRAALHSAEIQWNHPVSRKIIKVCSPLPKDMVEFARLN